MDHLLRPSDTVCATSYGEMAQAPQAALEGFAQLLAATPAQDPQGVADAIAALVKTPAGRRPFRTTVDTLGMGSAIEGYNRALADVTQGLYRHLGIEHMLAVQPG